MQNNKPSNPNHKPELDLMNSHIEEIRNDLLSMKNTIIEMYHALVGNSVLKDGGLVKKFEDLESKVLKQADDLEDLKNNYIKLKWLALGVAVGAGILGFSMKDIVNHFF
jgi:hypothetical protein